MTGFPYGSGELASVPRELARLARLAGVDQPAGDDTQGARWLQATAARAQQVASCLAAGETRSSVVRLHAHYAVEDPGYDLRRVAADLHVRVRGTYKHKGETQFAAEAALLPVARALLEQLSRRPVRVTHVS